jgi:hypothetical protein
MVSYPAYMNETPNGRKPIVTHRETEREVAYLLSVCILALNRRDVLRVVRRGCRRCTCIDTVERRFERY